MTRQFSPLGFETTYFGGSATEYEHSHTPAHHNTVIYSTSKYMAKLSEIDVATAWSNGTITSARTTYLEDTLTQGWYFDNNVSGMVSGGFGFAIAPIITPEDDVLESSRPHTYFNILSFTCYADTVYVLGTMQGVLHLYTADKHKYNSNITTPTQQGEPVGEITISLPIPFAVGSPIYAAYGKLWIVNTVQSVNLNNFLHCYDIATSTWSTTTIPGRHQFEERRISDDFDGNIIVTNKNDHAVVIINASTLAHVKTIKVNRHTYGLSRTENKVFYVMSDKQNSTLNSTGKSDAGLVNSAGASAGLFVPETPAAEQSSALSTIDIAAGSATLVGTAAGADYVIDDLRTGYRWCVGGPVGWTVLSSSTEENARDDADSIYETYNGGTEYTYKGTVANTGELPPASTKPKPYDTYFVTDDKMLYSWKSPNNVRIKISTQSGDEAVGVDCIQGVITNQFTYDHYDPKTNTTTSSTVRPFLFVRTTNAVYAYRLTSLKGVNSSQVLGTAMIAIGPQAYIGD
jgi:hypothetical protein